ncbi:L,D-transpeptidase [Curtobacterium sp. MCSS17_015]|uniref:L,D-transpeptidase n=1 Tax=Curtobacterium sp. MCSS17_015 TaxID=2175666 RepID=UPI000DA7E8C7|nr:L,D-transpeptidase [Curtobacterium sp. MCSS17_015]WIB27713.1 L,D-transpeptidase [Curtobacterium sp. MCSS17_015]
MTEPSAPPHGNPRRWWIVGAGALAVVVAAGTVAWSLAALPLAFHDAVISQLLDGSQVDARNQWTTATPKAPLVPLYAAPDADAAPVATLSSSVSTLNTPTATAVWGRTAGEDGGMVLVSTPSRNRTPGDGGVAEAPSSTFAWARAADFTLASIDREVRIDNATSTIAIVHRDGTTETSETARLGTPEDPTPADTKTYMEANYVDPQVPYTQGHPIALTGAHSSKLAGYGGNAALTALHFYPDPTGSSHGCVRVTAAMTDALATLPIGTPIEFS